MHRDWTLIRAILVADTRAQAEYSPEALNHHQLLVIEAGYVLRIAIAPGTLGSPRIPAYQDQITDLGHEIAAKLHNADDLKAVLECCRAAGVGTVSEIVYLLMAEKAQKRLLESAIPPMIDIVAALESCADDERVTVFEALSARFCRHCGIRQGADWCQCNNDQ
jgi:hypothetical protein